MSETTGNSSWTKASICRVLVFSNHFVTARHTSRHKGEIRTPRSVQAAVALIDCMAVPQCVMISQLTSVRFLLCLITFILHFHGNFCVYLLKIPHGAIEHSCFPWFGVL